MSDKHHPLLLSLLAEELGCGVGDIVDFELNLCDVQPGVVGGAAGEFVYVGRLDNLASCYTALQVGRGWGMEGGGGGERGGGNRKCGGDELPCNEVVMKEGGEERSLWGKVGEAQDVLTTWPAATPRCRCG
jgi:hypothetical protein